MLPAVDLTKHLLISLKKYAYHVRKLIVTSSHATIANQEQFSNANYIIDEENYNNITWDDSLVNGLYGYYGSKTFAERAVWDFKRNE